MRAADLHTGLYSRVFKSVLLSEDVARMEERGELLRPDPVIAQLVRKLRSVLFA